MHWRKLLNVGLVKGIITSNQSTELYLVQFTKGVFSVVFHQSQNFDSNFKINFLNQLTSN
jgi:hypothetical protein